MLSDGHAVYTPGLSENRGGSVTYPAFDRIGNLWTQDAAGKSQTFYEDFTGFGSLTALGGGNASPFRFGGGLGCQSDADTGLVLMGHRYFDPRLGRFITQDPAGDGENWYSYAGNDPANKTDPSGLEPQTWNGGSASINGPGYLAALSESMFAGMDASLAEASINTDVKRLLQRHVSPGAASTFSLMIFEGFLTYNMIGQTVGNGQNGSSGDTHHIVPGTNYSASTDLRIGKLSNKEAEQLVNNLALFGFAAFLRIPGEDHWSPSQARHIHAVYAGASLTASTLRQVRDFVHTPGLNGLRSHVPYQFFHWNSGNVQQLYEATH